MENIIISKEFLDWYDYYNDCKDKYSSLVNDVEDKLIRGEYKDIELPFSNMNTNNLNRDISSLEKIQVLMMQGLSLIHISEPTRQEVSSRMPSSA